mgnify:CR=1 FL=1
MQISNVMKQISNVDADIKIAQAAVTEKEKRVAELNEELKSLGQVQADIEKNIDTVLNFSIQKNKALAEKINPFSIISSSVSLITRLREIQWKLAR